MDKKESVRPLLRMLWFALRNNKEHLTNRYQRIGALKREIADLVFDAKCADLEDDTTCHNILIREKKDSLLNLKQEVLAMEGEQTEYKNRIKQLNRKL